MNLYEFSQQNNREMGILIERENEADRAVYEDAWKDIESELGLKAGKHKIVLTVNNGNYSRGSLYGEFASMHNLFEVRWKEPGAASHVSIPPSVLFNPGHY